MKPPAHLTATITSVISLFIGVFLLFPNPVWAQEFVGIAFGEPSSAVVGQELSLPLLITTGSTQIDGIQISGEVTGARIEGLATVRDGSLGLQTIKDEVAGTKFGVLLLSASPTKPLSFSTATEVMYVVFTPLEPGEIRVVIDDKNTLMTKHGTAENVVASFPEKMITVESGAAADEGPQPIPDTTNVMVAVAFIVLGVSALLGWFVYQRIKARSVQATTAQPGLSTPPSSPLPPDQVPPLPA